MRALARPFCCLFAFALLCSAPAAAQRVDVRTLSTRADGVTFEVTAEWALPLTAALDSLGASALTADVVRALSLDHLDARTLVPMPTGSATVRVTEQAYDAAPLPAAAPDSVLAWLTGPRATIQDVGTHRRQTTGTLVARLSGYEAGTFRRYRRLVLDVDFGAPGVAGARPVQLRAAGAARAEPSVLADGLVFKIPVPRSGIYRLGRDELDRLLSSAGRSLAGVRPGQIRLYQNPGRPLPALNSAPRPVDLIENAVRVSASGGQVQEVVFWADMANRETPGWRFDDEAGQWVHVVHPYAEQNYVFLKVADADGGARLPTVPFPGRADAEVLTQIRGRHVVEFDQVLWNDEHASGRTWYSEPQPRELRILDDAPLPGLMGGEVVVEARVAIQSNPAARVFFESGGAVIGEAIAGIVGSGELDPTAREAQRTFPFAHGGGPLSLRMRVEQKGDAKAALDWVRIDYPMALRASDGTLRFHTPGGQAGAFEFVLQGFAAAPEVWDVTDVGALRRLEVRSSGSTHRVQVIADDAAAPRELVAFVPAAVRTLDVGAGQAVAAQDLRGRAGYPEFVIVAPDTFRTLAEELADLRRGEGLAVEVVDVEAIFNAFGGGQRDPLAIRDYFKFLYDRGPGADPALRYALLFGDGHYDYRGLTAPDGEEDEELYPNWIPPYESVETLDPLRSYTSDDYFGLLDDDEGLWPYLGAQSPSPERVDIGIGRFTVNTAEDARVVLDKLRRYGRPETYGPWRTRYTFLADDGYNRQSPVLEGTPDQHTRDSDLVALQVEGYAPALNVQKIYGISYDRVQSGSSYALPGVERDVIAALNNGTLLINYSGHGGEDGLAQERIFENTDIHKLTNGDRLAIFMTATCSYGRWDMSDEQSGAEQLLTYPAGGAVALMTTVRTVFTSAGEATFNVILNRELNEALLEPEADGQPRRLGDALRIAKNTSGGAQGNNRKFNLLGDPTMRIGLPTYQAAVGTVNGVALDEQAAPLRALDRVTIQGTVLRPDSSLATDFSGPVNVTVFDAERRVPIEPQYQGLMGPRSRWDGAYRVREDLIWRGDVQAENGRYQATFVVPKDISYSDRPGRISVYAHSGDRQAAGFTERVIVGGTADQVGADQRGPDVRLFLNDTTFVSGGMTPNNPELIVRLFDESGINTVGAGVGHEMLLVVDGDEANARSIGGQYEAEPNSYQRGRVAVALGELAPGPHTLRVKAWDVANNSSEATLDFYVSTSEALVVRNLFNYPNPTVGPTEFVFEHNQLGGTPAEVELRIYTLAGQPIRTLDPFEALPLGVLSGGLVRIPWDGLDQDGDRLATGVYLYKVRVQVEREGGEREVSEILEKLAVIR